MISGNGEHILSIEPKLIPIFVAQRRKSGGTLWRTCSSW